MATAHQQRRVGIRVMQATGVLLAGLSIGACGQSPTATAPAAQLAPPPAPAPAPAAGPAAAAEPRPVYSGANRKPAAPPEAERGQRCHTSMLSGSIVPGSPGAGQRYADIVLRNVSGESCTLYGYGGMQLVDAQGRDLPTSLERNADAPPVLIELAPGQSARASMHWTAVPTGDEPTTGPCQPEAASVHVTPPDERDHLTIPWTLGEVCDHGSIDGDAYRR